jgi:4-hydroxybenzoyl-CoA thioesterase
MGQSDPRTVFTVASSKCSTEPFAFRRRPALGHQLSTSFGIIGSWWTRANFLKPIKFGDVVDIASRIIEFRRSSFDIEHLLSVNGEIAVEGGETRVWASRSKDDPEKIGASPIPGDVIARFGPG